MVIFSVIIVLLWLIILPYWFITSMLAKRSLINYNWWKGAGVRVVCIIIILVFIRTPGLKHAVRGIPEVFFFNPIIASIGVLLCAGGITLAIWARAVLGKEWGMPMTDRIKPTLVTKGPYAYIRHPIYSGFIIALAGTTLVNGLLWLIPFIVLAIYFVYSAKTEEKQMSNHFPEEYAAYKKRTKALIPFIY